MAGEDSASSSKVVSCYPHASVGGRDDMGCGMNENPEPGGTVSMGHWVGDGRRVGGCEGDCVMVVG